DTHRGTAGVALEEGPQRGRAPFAVGVQPAADRSPRAAEDRVAASGFGQRSPLRPQAPGQNHTPQPFEKTAPPIRRKGSDPSELARLPFAPLGRATAPTRARPCRSAFVAAAPEAAKLHFGRKQWGARSRSTATRRQRRSRIG